MYDIIDSSSLIFRGTQIRLDSDRLVRMQRAAASKVIKHYNQFYATVDSVNPFLRLLYQINGGRQALSPPDYYNRSVQYENELCSAVGFTNDTHRGDTFYNVFWKETPVAIVTSNFYGLADLFAMANWQHIIPVRVSVHPGLSYSLSRPDLSHAKGDYGVVTVDLPALSYMYGHWLANNLLKPIGEREQPESFLAKFVFPNMIVSQHDAIIINSFNVDRLDLTEASKQDTPIQVIDNCMELLLVVDHIFEKMAKSTTYDQALGMLPSLQKHTMLQTINDFNPRITKANRWVEALASAPLVLGLSNALPDNPERDEVRLRYNQIRRKYKMDGTIDKITDGKLRKRLRADIDVIDKNLKTDVK